MLPLRVGVFNGRSWGSNSSDLFCVYVDMSKLPDGFILIHVNLERKPALPLSGDRKGGIGMMFAREGSNFVVMQLNPGGSADRSLQVHKFLFVHLQ
jgi:hypothetical protein